MPEFQKPEYLHVVINHLPVYGLAVSALALLIGLIFRNRPVQMTASLLVALTALSFWPVAEFGEKGEDRVESMVNSDGKAWLEYHAGLADRYGWLFYVTAGAAATHVVLAWRRWKWTVPVGLVVFILCLGALGAVAQIAWAGGKIRHPEFRTGPP